MSSNLISLRLGAIASHSHYMYSIIGVIFGLEATERLFTWTTTGNGRHGQKKGAGVIMIRNIWTNFLALSERRISISRDTFGGWAALWTT
jgi:hypothetical protein